MNRILRAAITTAARQNLGKGNKMTRDELEAALLSQVEDSGTVEGEYNHGDNTLTDHDGYMRWFTLRLSKEYSIRVTINTDVNGVYDDENGERHEIGSHAEHDDFVSEKYDRMNAAEQCEHEPETFSDWCAECRGKHTDAEYSVWYRCPRVIQYDLVSDTCAIDSPYELKDTEYDADMWGDYMTSPDQFDYADMRCEQECKDAEPDWFNWSELIELANQHIPREGV